MTQTGRRQSHLTNSAGIGALRVACQSDHMLYASRDTPPVIKTQIHQNIRMGSTHSNENY